MGKLKKARERCKRFFTGKKPGKSKQNFDGETYWDGTNVHRIGNYMNHWKANCTLILKKWKSMAAGMNLPSSDNGQWTMFRPRPNSAARIQRWKSMGTGIDGLGLEDAETTRGQSSSIPEHQKVFQQKIFRDATDQVSIEASSGVSEDRPNQAAHQVVDYASTTSGAIQADDDTSSSNSSAGTSVSRSPNRCPNEMPAQARRRQEGQTQDSRIAHLTEEQLDQLMVKMHVSALAMVLQSRLQI